MIRLTAISLLTFLLLGCGVDPFPGSPDRTGASDVPFVPTYNFAFRTGFGPVLGIDANLTIISAGDLLNLVAAANVTQRLGTGVITGIVESLSGAAAEGVTLLLTDAEGNVVGDVFYNGLGGVPNFVQTTGTDSTGAFTIFNVPPGEVFLKAIQGGRGNTRLMVFPDAVSLTNFRVLSVIPAKASVASLVLEVTNFIPEDPIGVSTVGIISD
ncbi:MAG: carboxypeptidase-like regulatory domain-containing protein, partial [Nitrospira sp.]|nr:carboxypeptidase-like regulatory domain-containing protein [Nitrospira sp.]